MPDCSRRPRPFGHPSRLGQPSLVWAVGRTELFSARPEGRRHRRRLRVMLKRRCSETRFLPQYSRHTRGRRGLVRIGIPCASCVTRTAKSACAVLAIKLSTTRHTRRDGGCRFRLLVAAAAARPPGPVLQVPGSLDYCHESFILGPGPCGCGDPGPRRASRRPRLPSRALPRSGSNIRVILIP